MAKLGGAPGLFDESRKKSFGLFSVSKKLFKGGWTAAGLLGVQSHSALSVSKENEPKEQHMTCLSHRGIYGSRDSSNQMFLTKPRFLQAIVDG